MNKKTLKLVVAGVVLFLACPVFAQLNTEDVIELSRTYIETNRQTIVASAMELTEEESAVFWPVYQGYRAMLDPINDRFVKILRDYADNYEDLSDEKAAEIMSEYLDIEEDRLIHKKLYMARLIEVLPMSKVTRFFQIENKMDATIKFELAVEIPLANINKKTETEPEMETENN